MVTYCGFENKQGCGALLNNDLFNCVVVNTIQIIGQQRDLFSMTCNFPFFQLNVLFMKSYKGIKK